MSFRDHGVRGKALPAGALFLCLVVVCALPADRARAEGEAHALLKGFQRTGRYILVVDGQKAERAKIYHSRLAAAYLMLDTPLGDPVLISPRTQLVQRVPVEQMFMREDGNIYLLADAQPVGVTKYVVQQGHVVFTMNDLPASLQPNPPLVGLHTGEALIAHTPEYEHDGRFYVPDPAAVAALKQAPGPIDVLVVFGSWCPTCRRYLPNVLKLEQAVEGSGIHFRYYGLPSGEAAWRDPAFVRSGLRHLPAVVVSSGGRVIGRLSGHEVARPEVGLSGMLQ